MKIFPEIALSETYRSNIYQTETDAESDFVTTIRPGVRLDYQFGDKHMLTLGYNAGWLSYARNSQNNYWDQKANGLLDLNFAGGLEFKLGDQYTNSTLERSAVNAYERPYAQNSTNSSLSYKFADRWKAEAKYSRDWLSFDKNRDRDSNYLQDLFGGVIYYRFTARTAALLEYNYITKRFDRADTDDHKDSNVYLGVTFDPSGKLQGGFKAGYGWKKFDKRVAGRNNSPDNWIVEGNVIENFSKYTSLLFNTSRAFYDDSDSNNASNIKTGAGMTFQHFFTGKTGAFASVAYSQADYLDASNEPVTGNMKKREDKRWDTGCGLIFKANKWLDTRLEYLYINKNSNFETYSFDENKVMFRVTLTP